MVRILKGSLKYQYYVDRIINVMEVPVDLDNSLVYDSNGMKMEQKMKILVQGFKFKSGRYRCADVKTVSI